MLRGSGGFGLRHHLRTDEQLSLSEDLPVAVIAVDTTHAITGLLDQVTAIQKRGLLTVERARADSSYPSRTMVGSCACQG